MGGGNLSLQVHPLTEYIRDTFGMALHAGRELLPARRRRRRVVYLGAADRRRPGGDARRSARGDRRRQPFHAEKYVNIWPARKHDHFLIPAGTVHCSGADSMVLEISATPYIFTFKLWDWGRLGLDGVPRPIHLDHGEQNIQWDRDTEWIAAQSGRPGRGAPPRARPASRSAPGCTSASSSRRAGTGSTRRPPTTRRAASTC